MRNGQMEEMFVAQIPQLRRYARALTQDSAQADDLVQDCLERAWRRAHRWQPDTNLRAWLFTIMHNLFVNMVRRHRIRPDKDPVQESGAPDPRAEDQKTAMRLRDLELGLAELPPEQREVLLLVCLEERSYKQAADILGLPIGTIMSRLHRARERMRRWLAEEKRPSLRRVK